MKIKVSGSDIRIVKRELLVTGALNAYEILFEFDKRWNDMVNKTAVFYQPSVNNGAPTYRILDENNRVLIPYGSLVKDDYLYIGVFGFTEDSEVVLPTIYTYVYVKVGTYSADDVPVPDPSVYQQIYNMALRSVHEALLARKVANEALDIAKQVKQAADDGEFDGFSPEVDVVKQTSDTYILRITTKDGPIITPNLKGEKGDPGSDVGATFIYDQAIESNRWEINHKLGKYPSVAVVVDGINDTVYGDVTYIDNNKLVIEFNGQFTGKAYLN